jgi:hypothetical protein
MDWFEFDSAERIFQGGTEGMEEERERGKMEEIVKLRRRGLHDRERTTGIQTEGDLNQEGADRDCGTRPEDGDA